jgi:hypothetical protein
MGVKAFFGKSIASMLQAHQNTANETLAAQAQVRAATDMERMFGNCSPAMVAFRIENGFVVRTVNQEEAYEGKRQGGFTYCKDHQEIAEHLIALEAKRKMGLTYSPEAVQKRAAIPNVVASGSGGSGQYRT